MKRDVPIPWSVSLPCVVALGALLFGWHSFSSQSHPRSQTPPQTPPPPPPQTPPEPPLPVAVPSRSQPESPPPQPQAKAPAPVAAAATWPTLATIRADDLPGGANDAAARALQKLRDRLGIRASTVVWQSVAKSRVVVVVATDAQPERGDPAVRTLASFGERLQTRILVPARIDLSLRPWIALYLGDAAEVQDFGGVVWSANEAAPLAAIAERQLRGALARGPELHLLPWAVAGAAGVAASESPNELLAGAEPLPSLASLMKWGMKAGPRPDREAEFERGATSFVAFCLARGPRDPAATGFFELLKLDSSLLPTTDEARDGEVAARLGATRLEELESAWRQARR